MLSFENHATATHIMNLALTPRITFLLHLLFHQIPHHVQIFSSVFLSYFNTSISICKWCKEFSEECQESASKKQPLRMNRSSWRRTADTVCHSKRRIRHNFIGHPCYKNAWPQQALNIQNIYYISWENYVFFLSTRRKTSCAKKPVADPVKTARAKSTGA